MLALSLGIVVYVIEVLLFRWLFALLGGNELVIGFLFLFWFLFSGLGAILFSKLALSKPRRAVDFWLLSFPLVISISLFFLVSLTHSPRFAFGRQPGILESIWIIIAALSLPAIFSGMGFSLYSNYFRDAAFVFSRESMGFGIASFFVFAAVLMGIPMVWVALLAMLFVGHLLVKRYGFLRLFAIWIVFFLFFALFPYYQQRLSSLGRVLYLRDSPIARIAIKETKNQKALFYNNRYVTDFKDYAFSEMVVHIAAMQLRHFGKAVVVGSAVRGIIRELEKYPFEEIVVYDRDPVILDILEELCRENGWNNVLLRVFKDLKFKNLSQVDLFIIGYTDPVTLADSVFLSREFLGSVKDVLGKGGIAVVPAAGNLDFMSRPLLWYSRVVYDTLSSVFARVKYISGNTAIFLASDDKDICIDLDFFERRYRELHIENRYFSPYMWQVLLDPWRLRIQENSIKALTMRRLASTKLTPLVFEYFFRFYLYSFDRVLWRIWRYILMVFACLALFIGLGLPILMRIVKLKENTLICVFYSSFMHMTLYLMIIFFLQISHGSFFQDMVVFTGMYMFGLGLGLDRLKIPVSLYWRGLFLFGVLIWGAGWIVLPRWLFYLLVFCQAAWQGAYLSYAFKRERRAMVFFSDLFGAGMAALLVPVLVANAGIYEMILAGLLGLFIVSQRYRL